MLTHTEARPRVPKPLLGGRLHRETSDVEINHVEVERVARTCYDDAVYEPQRGGDPGRAHPHDRLGQEDAHVVDLRRPLDALGDAHVGRQVGRVDLKLAAHGALDGPPEVQAAGHIDAAAGAHPLQQARVLAVGGQQGRAVDCSEDPRKRNHGHVGHPLLHLVRGVGQNRPDHEVGIAVVLVGGAVELGDDAVHDLGDLVDKRHHLALQHLDREEKLLDANIPQDAVHALAFHHAVHAGGVPAHEVALDDPGARLSEPERE
mmetsp:Transcript_55036/g.143234  ORF Transcript_55036/g.143234 Transcript_55036/m.143234 type:complete len:261 (+) Transcript_55036:382-1164(+)